MSAELIAVIAVIAIAMVFDYTNGFHDAANAIATSISTRALTPRAALALAAVGNFGGAYLGRHGGQAVHHEGSGQGEQVVEVPIGGLAAAGHERANRVEVAGSRTQQRREGAQARLLGMLARQRGRLCRQGIGGLA